MYLQIFYTNVLKILKVRKMTKKDLAQLTGLSPAYLTMITKQNTNPTLNVMQKIATALDVPLPYLLLNNDLPKVESLIETNAPKGYEYVSVILPTFRAHLVKKWSDKAELEISKKLTLNKSHKK